MHKYDKGTPIEVSWLPEDSTIRLVPLREITQGAQDSKREQELQLLKMEFQIIGFEWPG